MDISEILSNPLVWGLLVWLFSRVFTSRNKDEEMPNKQSAGQEHQSKNRPIPKPKPVKATVEQETRKEVVSTVQTVQQTFENIKYHNEDQNKSISKEQRLKRTPVAHEKLIPKVNRNVKLNPLILDREKAVQGIVWSEILGAPRSKNPHYTRKRRQS